MVRYREPSDATCRLRICSNDCHCLNLELHFSDTGDLMIECEDCEGKWHWSAAEMVKKYNIKIQTYQHEFNFDANIGVVTNGIF